MPHKTLKELRESKNITQSQFSEHLEVSMDYVSMIERGVRTPGLKLAKKIADYFDTTIEQIFFDNKTH